MWFVREFEEIEKKIPWKNSYFRYKCEKVILSSWGCLHPSETRVKRPHEDKITFSFEYRTQFFDTTCSKLNLGHAFLLERVQNPALRTECENFFFFFNVMCKTRLFMLVVHAQSGFFTHGVRKSRACADQFIFRTTCVKELLCARKTNNKISFAHLVKKK